MHSREKSEMNENSSRNIESGEQVSSAEDFMIRNEELQRIPECRMKAKPEEYERNSRSVREFANDRQTCSREKYSSDNLRK